MGVSSIAFLPLACIRSYPSRGDLTTRTAAAQKARGGRKAGRLSAAGKLPYSSDTAPFSQTAAFLKLRRSTNTAESY